MLSHGESIGLHIKCNNGEIEHKYNPCITEESSIPIPHGKKVRMLDDIARQCDNGTMKPPECEHFFQKSIELL